MSNYGKMAFFAALVALSGCHSAGQNNTAAAADPDMDRCGASELQKYVGQPLDALEGLHFDKPVRAIPYDSAVTMDFNLNRINFLGNRQGKIESVYCG